MDYLRWILLAIAIILVIAIYFWSRSRNKSWDSSPLNAANDVPSFAAKDNTDAWEDGVGPVRVVGDNNIDEVLDELKEEKKHTLAEKYRQKNRAAAEAQQQKAEAASRTQYSEKLNKPETEDKKVVEKETIETDEDDDDLIVIYLLADQDERLKGEQILSAAVASHLEYGDMRIFHHMDDAGKIQFSMADMKQPGWFDYENMHKLKTRGVTFFMQAQLCTNPVKALDDMLLCAHSMASMLGARLCDHNRHLLNETVVRSLREKAKAFHRAKA